MTNPTIVVTLDSLEAGTHPSVTSSVEVAQNGQIDVTVTWPSSASNTINVDLQFNDDTQDPFNDETDGDTNFDLTRSSPTASATQTMNVTSDATVTSDTYCLTLTVDGTQYSTDPTIIVDEN